MDRRTLISISLFVLSLFTVSVITAKIEMKNEIVQNMKSEKSIKSHTSDAIPDVHSATIKSTTATSEKLHETATISATVSTTSFSAESNLNTEPSKSNFALTYLQAIKQIKDTRNLRNASTHHIVDLIPSKETVGISTISQKENLADNTKQKATSLATNIVSWTSPSSIDLLSSKLDNHVTLDKSNGQATTPRKSTSNLNSKTGLHWSDPTLNVSSEVNYSSSIAPPAPFNGNTTAKFTAHGVSGSMPYSHAGMHKDTSVYFTAQSRQNAKEDSIMHSSTDRAKAEKFQSTFEQPISASVKEDFLMNALFDTDLSEETEPGFDDKIHNTGFSIVLHSLKSKRVTLKTETSDNHNTPAGTDSITPGYSFDENFTRIYSSPSHEEGKNNTLDIYDSYVTSKAYLHNNKMLEANMDTENLSKTSGNRATVLATPHTEYNSFSNQTALHNSVTSRNDRTAQYLNFKNRTQEHSDTSYSAFKPRFTSKRGDSTFSFHKRIQAATTTLYATKTQKHPTVLIETVPSGFRDENKRGKIYLPTSGKNEKVTDLTKNRHGANVTITFEDQTEYLAKEIPSYTIAYDTKILFQENKQPRIDHTSYIVPIYQTAIDYIVNHSTAVSKEIIREDSTSLVNTSEDVTTKTAYPIDKIKTPTYNDPFTQIKMRDTTHMTANDTANKLQNNPTTKSMDETFRDRQRQKPQTGVTDTIEELKTGDTHSTTGIVTQKLAGEDEQKTAYEISSIISGLTTKGNMQTVFESIVKEMYTSLDNITRSPYVEPLYESKEKQVSMSVITSEIHEKVLTVENETSHSVTSVEVQPTWDDGSNVTLDHTFKSTINVTPLKTPNTTGSIMPDSFSKTSSNTTNNIDVYNYKNRTTRDVPVFMSNVATSNSKFLYNSSLTNHTNGLHDDVTEKTRIYTHIKHTAQPSWTSVADGLITFKDNTSNTSVTTSRNEMFMTTAGEALILQKMALLKEVPRTRVSRSTELNDRTLNSSLFLTENFSKKTGLENDKYGTVKNEDLPMFTEGPISTPNFKTKSADFTMTASDDEHETDVINRLMTTAYHNLTELNTNDRKSTNNAGTGIYQILYFQHALPSIVEDKTGIIYTSKNPNYSTNRNRYTLGSNTERYTGEITSSQSIDFDQMLETANKTKSDAETTMPKKHLNADEFKQSAGIQNNQSMYIALATNNPLDQKTIYNTNTGQINQLEAIMRTSPITKTDKRFATTAVKKLSSSAAREIIEDSHTFSSENSKSLKSSTTQERDLKAKSKSVLGYESSFDSALNVLLHANTLSFVPDSIQDRDVSEPHDITPEDQHSSNFETVGNTTKTKYTKSVVKSNKSSTTVIIPTESFSKASPVPENGLTVKFMRDDMLKNTDNSNKNNPTIAKVTDIETSVAANSNPFTYQAFTYTKSLSIDSNKTIEAPMYKTTRTTVSNISFDSTFDFFDDSSIKTSETTHSAFNKNTPQFMGQFDPTSNHLAMDTAVTLLNNYPSIYIKKFESSLPTGTDREPFSTGYTEKTTKFGSIAKSEIDNSNGNVTTSKLTIKPNQSTRTATTTTPTSIDAMHYPLNTNWSLRSAKDSGENGKELFSQNAADANQYSSIRVSSTTTIDTLASNKEVEVQQYNRLASIEGLLATTSIRENSFTGKFSNDEIHNIHKLNNPLMFSRDRGKHDTVSNVPEKSSSHMTKISVPTEETKLRTWGGVPTEIENSSIPYMNAITSKTTATKTKLSPHFNDFMHGKDENILTPTDSISRTTGKQKEQPAGIQSTHFYINSTKSHTAAFDISSTGSVYLDKISTRDHVSYDDSKPLVVYYTKSSPLKTKDSSTIDVITSQPVHTTMSDPAILKDVAAVNSADEYITQLFTHDETEKSIFHARFTENQKEVSKSNGQVLKESFNALASSTSSMLPGSRTVKTSFGIKSNTKKTENSVDPYDILKLIGKNSTVRLKDKKIPDSTIKTKINTEEIAAVAVTLSNEQIPTVSHQEIFDLTGSVLEKSETTSFESTTRSTVSTSNNKQLTFISPVTFHEDSVKIHYPKQSQPQGYIDSFVNTTKTLSVPYTKGLSKQEEPNTTFGFNEALPPQKIAAKEQGDQIPASSYPSANSINMEAISALTDDYKSVKFTMKNEVTHSSSDKPFVMISDDRFYGGFTKSSQITKTVVASEGNKSKATEPAESNFSSTVEATTHINITPERSWNSSLPGHSTTSSIRLLSESTDPETKFPDYVKHSTSDLEGERDEKLQREIGGVGSVNGDMRLHFTQAVNFDVTSAGVSFMTRQNKLDQRSFPQLPEQQTAQQFPTKISTFFVSTESSHLKMPYSTMTSNPDASEFVNLSDATLNHITHSHDSEVTRNAEKTKLRQVSSFPAADYQPYSFPEKSNTVSAKEHSFKRINEMILLPITVSASTNTDMPIKVSTALLIPNDQGNKAFYSQTKELSINTVNPNFTNNELTKRPYTATETVIHKNYESMSDDIIETTTVAQDNQSNLFSTDPVRSSPDEEKSTRFTDVSLPIRRDSTVYMFSTLTSSDLIGQEKLLDNVESSHKITPRIVENFWSDTAANVQFDLKAANTTIMQVTQIPLSVASDTTTEMTPTDNGPKKLHPIETYTISKTTDRAKLLNLKILETEGEYTTNPVSQVITRENINNILGSPSNQSDIKVGENFLSSDSRNETYMLSTHSGKRDKSSVDSEKARTSHSTWQMQDNYNAQHSVEGVYTSSSEITPQISFTWEDRNAATSSTGVYGKRLKDDMNATSAGLLLNVNKTFSFHPTAEPVYSQSFTKGIPSTSLLSDATDNFFASQNDKTTSTLNSLYKSQYSNDSLSSVNTKYASTVRKYSVDSNGKKAKYFDGNSTLLRHTLLTVQPPNLESDNEISTSIGINNKITNEVADLTKVGSIQINTSSLQQPHTVSEDYSVGVTDTLYEDFRNTEGLDETTDVSIINESFHTPLAKEDTNHTLKHLNDISRSLSPLTSSYFFNFSTTKFQKVSSKSYEDELQYSGPSFFTDTDIVSTPRDMAHQSNERSVFSSKSNQISDDQFTSVPTRVSLLENMTNKHQINLESAVSDSGINDKTISYDYLSTDSKHVQSSSLTDSDSQTSAYSTKEYQSPSKSHLTKLFPPKIHVTEGNVIHGFSTGAEMKTFQISAISSTSAPNSASVKYDDINLMSGYMSPGTLSTSKFSLHSFPITKMVKNSSRTDLLPQTSDSNKDSKTSYVSRTSRKPAFHFSNSSGQFSFTKFRQLDGNISDESLTPFETSSSNSFVKKLGKDTSSSIFKKYLGTSTDAHLPNLNDASYSSSDISFLDISSKPSTPTDISYMENHHKDPISSVTDLSSSSNENSEFGKDPVIVLNNLRSQTSTTDALSASLKVKRFSSTGINDDNVDVPNPLSSSMSISATSYPKKESMLSHTSIHTDTRKSIAESLDQITHWTHSTEHQSSSKPAYLEKSQMIKSVHVDDTKTSTYPSLSFNSSVATIFSPGVSEKSPNFRSIPVKKYPMSDVLKHETTLPSYETTFLNKSFSDSFTSILNSTGQEIAFNTHETGVFTDSIKPSASDKKLRKMSDSQHTSTLEKTSSDLLISDTLPKSETPPSNTVSRTKGPPTSSNAQTPETFSLSVTEVSSTVPIIETQSTSFRQMFSMQLSKTPLTSETRIFSSKVQTAKIQPTLTSSLHPLITENITTAKKEAFSSKVLIDGVLSTSGLGMPFLSAQRPQKTLISKTNVSFSASLSTEAPVTLVTEIISLSPNSQTLEITPRSKTSGSFSNALVTRAPTKLRTGTFSSEALTEETLTKTQRKISTNAPIAPTPKAEISFSNMLRRENNVTLEREIENTSPTSITRETQPMSEIDTSFLSALATTAISTSTIETLPPNSPALEIQQISETKSIVPNTITHALSRTQFFSLNTQTTQTSLIHTYPQMLNTEVNQPISGASKLSQNTQTANTQASEFLLTSETEKSTLNAHTAEMPSTSATKISSPTVSVESSSNILSTVTSLYVPHHNASKSVVSYSPASSSNRETTYYSSETYLEEMTSRVISRTTEPAQDTDECHEKRDKCPTASICVDIDGEYTCLCDEGYRRLDFICIDVNECLDVNSCPVNAECMNTRGSFRCECSDGFIMVGSLCQDLDECAESLPCPGNALCENVSGGYLCNCDNGFRLVAAECKDINECEDNVCAEHAVCENSPGSYACLCLNGYGLSAGGDCADIDECTNSPCGEYSVCENVQGSYMCGCIEGYSEDKHVNCSDIDECANNPCPRSSDCINVPGSFLCSCHYGYYLQEDSFSCLESKIFAASIRAINFNDSEIILSELTSMEVSLVVDAILNTVESSLNKKYPLVNVLNVTSISEGSVIVNLTLYLASNSTYNSDQLYSLMRNDPLVWTMNLLNVDSIVVEDVDECSDPGLNRCSEFADCINTPGSYECKCHVGYLDISTDRKGRDCAMIDENHQDIIMNLVLRLDQRAYPVDAMATMSVTMERGSHVTFHVQFGDGTEATIVHEEILAFRYAVNITHQYNSTGNFTVTLTASNNVSFVTKTDVIVVQTLLHSLTFEVDDLDSLYTGDKQFTVASAEVFNNVHIAIDFGDATVRNLYLDNLDEQFTFNYSYNVGHFLMVANISNMVGWIELEAHISAVELISGVKVLVVDKVKQPEHSVQIVVSTETGSGIVLETDYGNGQQDQIKKQNKRGPTETVLSIVYTSPGEYLVNMTLLNNKSSWNELVGPIFVQNPVKMLNMLINPITPVPPGVVNLDVTYTQDLFPPTAVTCDMIVNEVFRNYSYSAELHKGDFLHVEVKVDDPDISGWATVKLNCSNMISSQYIETGTYMQHIIQNISINMEKSFIPVGENVVVEFQIQKGSHVEYAYNFDSESNKTGIFANDIIHETRMNDSYTFGQPGLRIVSFYVRNSVSEESVSASIWVLQDIEGLTLDRYYAQSSVNNLISYGHGNEGNIFPLQRPVIFNTSVLAGNNIQYEWRFGDGNVTSTFNPTIHHTYKHYGNFTVEATAFNQLYSERKTLSIMIFDIVLPLRLSNDGPKKSYLPILFTIELTYVGTMPCFIWNMGDNSSTVMYGADNCPAEADYNNLNYSTYTESVVSQTMQHSHTYQHEGIYEASVITFNSVSVTSVQGKAVVSGISCFYPEVNFIGGRKIVDKPIKKLRSDWITLESTAVINCETSNKPLYHWSIQKVSQGQTYLEYNLDPYDTNIATVDKLKIFFLPQSLDIGLYKVSINVSMSGVAGLYTVEYTYLEISATPLVVSIIGGTARSVSYNSYLQLDGISGTFDPDGSTNLTFEWWCRQEHESFNDLSDKTVEIPSAEYDHNSKGNGGCFGTGIGRLSYTEGLIQLSTVLLEPKSGNVFLLIVSEGNRQACFEQTVHVVEGDPPTVQIDCIKNCKTKMNPSSELSLVSSCEDCYGQFSTQYLWSLYIENDGQFSHLDLLPLISTDIKGASIVFRPKVLEGGKIYKVRLDVKLYGHTPAFTEHTFVTNLPPYGGNCSINPETGYALDTLFTIQCQGWMIPGEEQLQGEGLLYRFWTQVRGGSDLQLLYYGPDPFTAPSKFPLGLQEADYKHDIVVHVSDAIGEYVETQLETKVLPVPKQNLDKVRALALESSSPLQTMKQAGQDQEYKQLIVAMASVLNVPEERGSSHTLSSTISTSSLNPQSANSVVEDDQQSKEKNTQLRTTIVQQLSETDHVTLDALQQTALCFKVITKQRDELSKESQVTAVDAITRMTDHFTNIIEEPSRQQTSEQVILAAEEMLASVGNVVLAARVDIAGKLDELNEKESAKTVQREELEPLETLNIDAKDDNIVNETENLQVKELITKAIDVKDKILGSLAKTRAPGQDLYLQTEAFTIHTKREEPGKLDEAVLQSKSGKFLLPSSNTIFSDESIAAQFIDINFVEYPVNPFVWSSSAKYVNSAVVSLELVDSRGQQVNVTNLSTPLVIDIKLDSSLVKYQLVQAILLGKMELQHHVFRVRSNYSDVHIIVKPITEMTNDYLEVFISYDDVPTESEYIIKDVLPHLVGNIEEVNGIFNGTEQADLIEEELRYTVILSSDVLEQYGNGLWYLGIRKQVNDSREAYIYDDDLSVYYDNTLDNDLVTFNYSIGIMTTGCYFWDIKEEIWTNTGCQISPLSSSYFTRCTCNHLTSFGADFFVPPNSIQFETVFANMENDLKNNHVVLAMLSCLFLLYIIGLVWARYQDKKDVQKWGVLPLADNILSDSYFYEITVCTGMRHGAGTHSNISFILAGDHGDTGVRQLRDEKKMKQFSCGSINKFILSVDQGLGPLSDLRVWHDNSGVGKQQGWYLSKIVIQDLQDEKISVFLCNQWLAVEKEDGMIDRQLSVANRDDLTKFSSLFLSNTKKNLTDSHLWISIFSRPNWSNFSRIQRLSCLFALVMTSMLSSAMFYQIEARVENAQGYTLGPVKFTLQELYISIVTNMVVLPVSVVIVQLFRKSRPKKVIKNNAFNIHRPISTLSRLSMTLSGLFRTRTDVISIPLKDGTVQIGNDETTNSKPQILKRGFLAAFASEVLASRNKDCRAKSIHSNLQPVPGVSEIPVGSKLNETPVPAMFGSSSCNPPSPNYFDARHHYSPAPPLFFMKTSSTRNTVMYKDNVEYIQNDTTKKALGDSEHLCKGAHQSIVKSQNRNKSKFQISTEFSDNIRMACNREPELLSCDQKSLSPSSNVSPNSSPRTIKSPSAVSAFSFDSRSSISITKDMENIPMQPDNKHDASKGGTTLPHWCVYIAWLLVFLSSVVSAFLTFLYSMEWGKEKSMAWLASMLLSVLESVTIVQPLKILCLAIFVAVFLRKPEEELEREERKKVLYEIQPDEICAAQPTRKLIRQTDNVKPLDMEQLKKARKKRLKEMKMFRIVQEIVFYLFYLMILLLVASHNRDSNSYRMKQVLMNILSPKQNLTLIYETKHVWEWIDKFLVPGLYPMKHWNNSTIEDECNRLITTHVAYRLGPVRLRQHRVRPELCNVPKEMVPYVHKCSFDYDGDHASKGHFSEGWASYQGNKSVYPKSREPWLYKSSDDVDGLPYVGELGTYTGGGYISDLIGQRSHVTSTLAYLRNNNWMDAYTRILFIEFTIYNPNINLFTMTQVVLEMATSGTILPKAHFFTFRLFTYLGAYGIFMIICELTALACVIYFVGLELKQIRGEGRSYFKSFWNCLQLCTMLISLICVVMYLLRHAMTTLAMEKITKLEDKFYNFQRIAAWDDMFQTFLAVSLFFSFLKLIHLLRFNRRMSLLARTLKQSGREMAAFSLVLFIFMLAFVSCGHLLFGANVYGFSNMLRGFETLTAFSLGSYDFNYLTRYNHILGPVFFFVYFTFVAFVLINMFVTILNDAVTVVHQDVLKQTNEYEILEFLLSQLKSWLHIDLHKVILDVKKKYVPDLLTCEEIIDLDMREIEDKLDKISTKLDIMLTSAYYTDYDFDHIFHDDTLLQF